MILLGNALGCVHQVPACEKPPTAGPPTKSEFSAADQLVRLVGGACPWVGRVLWRKDADGPLDHRTIRPSGRACVLQPPLPRAVLAAVLCCAAPCCTPGALPAAPRAHPSDSQRCSAPLALSCRATVPSTRHATLPGPIGAPLRALPSDARRTCTAGRPRRAVGAPA